MKRIVKGVLRLGWGLLGPLRRPVARRVDAWLERALAGALARQAPLLSRTLRDDILEGEVHYLLDGVLRELVRLQLQLEAIEAHIEKASTEDPALVALTVAAPPEAGEAARQSA